jgi:hypothetical protein
VEKLNEQKVLQSNTLSSLLKLQLNAISCDDKVMSSEINENFQSRHGNLRGNLENFEYNGCLKALNFMRRVKLGILFGTTAESCQVPHFNSENTVTKCRDSKRWWHLIRVNCIAKLP